MTGTENKSLLQSAVPMASRYLQRAILLL